MCILSLRCRGRRDSSDILRCRGCTTLAAKFCALNELSSTVRTFLYDLDWRSTLAAELGARREACTTGLATLGCRLLQAGSALHAEFRVRWIRMTARRTRTHCIRTHLTLNRDTITNGMANVTLYSMPITLAAPTVDIATVYYNKNY